MNKVKQIFSRFRIILLIIVLVLSLIAMYPNPFSKGVAIRSVATNSSASFAGFENPKPTASPMSREVIHAINNVPIENLQEFYNELNGLRINSTAFIDTNKGTYNIFIDSTEIGLSVYDAPKSNIRKGLDLQGGTRVLLQPEEKLSTEDIGSLIDNMKQRLNVYGLSDLVIKEANDLPPPLGSGNQYIVVEIAGATKEEVSDLLAKQGKFEARVGNVSIFTGGDDIRSVCRSADCSGIDPQQPYAQYADGWISRFRFSITLSQAAADNMADTTKNLNVVTDENNQPYLEQQLLLFLDDAEVDQLNIAADLKGRSVTEIQITGSGAGATQQDAMLDALQNMKRMQTLLITGSLPVKINIAKTDSISPVLGEEFIRNALLVGALAILSVAIVIFLRYREIKISISMFITMVSEVIILLGVASIIGWNLDLAAIAGIIIAVGTGVDHQIVITDETLRGEVKVYDWKRRLKSALFIIMAAYFTTVVAMLPLVFAGAGLLKGFAITTIIGVSAGVFITRPAFATLIEILKKE